MTKNNKTKFKQTEAGEIPEEWEVRTLSSISTDISYGYTASAEEDPVGPKFLRITDIVPYFIDWESVPYCKINKKSFEKNRLEHGDLVIARTGATTGYNAIFEEDIDAVFASYLIRFKPNQDLADPKFLSYVLKSPLWDGYVSGIIGGSAQPGANAKQFGCFNLPLPPLPEQKRIASILSSLDDKIELNRRMNENLEEIGRTLFRRWFVEFEFPVSLCHPRPDRGFSSDEILKQVQDDNLVGFKSSGGKMVDSELGMIPEGWRVGKLGEVIEIFDSQRIPLSSREREQKRGEYRYYGATGVMDYVNDYLFDGIYLLLGEDGTVTKTDDTSYTQYVWGKFWVNNHAHVVKGKKGFSTELVKVILDQKNIKPYITGAVQLKLNQSNLKKIRILIPNNAVLKVFNLEIEKLYDLYRVNHEQIQSLSQLRDSLLSRLMSGRVRV